VVFIFIIIKYFYIYSWILVTFTLNLVYKNFVYSLPHNIFIYMTSLPYDIFIYMTWCIIRTWISFYTSLLIIIYIYYTNINNIIIYILILVFHKSHSMIQILFFISHYLIYNMYQHISTLNIYMNMKGKSLK